MIYNVRHVSTLSYASPVAQAQYNLRLQPWLWPGQQMRGSDLRIAPLPDLRQSTEGPYCVNTTRIAFKAPFDQLQITSEFTMAVKPPPVPEDSPATQRVRADAAVERDLSVVSPVPYLFPSRITGIDNEIGQWAECYLQANEGIVAAVTALMAALHGEFTYNSGATTSSTPPEEAFARREGVCQDFAHIMIIALRSHGIPAAYVSGYLRTLPPPGKPKLVGADAMHAWINVWCGHDLGWIGFDPTNNCLARNDHILIGMGRDYADVSPIDGTFIGSAPQQMKSAVDVTLAE